MVWFSRDLIGAREITFAADRPKEARLLEQITGAPVSPLYSADHDRHWGVPRQALVYHAPHGVEIVRTLKSPNDMSM
jgi:hypothetical protein